MDSIKIPDIMKVLRTLQQPKNRYQIRKELGLTYPKTIRWVNDLERMKYLFVLREEKGHGIKPVKYYLITAEGRAMLRGFEEAERRE